MATSLGIDFGTSLCRVFASGGSTAEPVTVDGAPLVVPSVVAWGPKGQLLVGADALRSTATPRDSVYGVKRLLGRKYHSQPGSWLREISPNVLVAGPNGDVCVRTAGGDRRPEALAALLLGQIVDWAGDALGKAPTSVVVSVPGFFDDAQRRALRNACALATTIPTRVVSEPAALALSYAHRGDSRGRVAVFDLGAGALDVSVLEVGSSAAKVIAVAGDSLLGGEDFDRRIVALLVDAFAEQYGIDLTTQPGALRRVYVAAERARRELSDLEHAAPILVRGVATRGDAENLDLRYDQLERALFESLCSEELESLSDPCAWALKDAGLGTDELDAVTIRGGASRTPAVQRAVAYMFNRAPLLGGDERVAEGAALAAARLAVGNTLGVDDVTAHSLGIKVRAGTFSPVLRRGHAIPCQERKVFAPARGGQSHVLLEVYQGESDKALDNVYLGRGEIAGIAPLTPLVVAFAVDDNGLLDLQRVDAKSGSAVSIPLVHAGGLSAPELAILMDRLATERARHTGTAPPPVDSIHIAPIAKERTDLRHGNYPSLVPPSQRKHASLRPPRPDRTTGEPAAGEITVADDSLVGSVLGERYVVEQIIAEGGMGRVYRARHKVLGRVVAVKVLHPSLAAQEELAQRFLQEAKAAARIHNEHVVTISDFGRGADGTSYFVMELLEGGTLETLIRDRGPQPPRVVRDIGEQLAHGLAAAHALAIVHRDLKPSNVTVLVRRDNPHFCKILDFGIAKMATSDSSAKRTTESGMLIGTPHYMAPEQIDGEIDARSDIYALGAVLYELVTGVPPFDASTIVAILVMHKSEPVRPIREHTGLASFPHELESIILDCLAKEPANRIQSAVELEALLRGLDL